MSKDNASFIKGTAILATAGLLARLMGAVYRFFLWPILGKEGMGYYSLAYPVYSSLVAVSTAGIPVAISKLVSERIAQRDNYGANQVFRMSMLLLLVTGFIGTAVLFFLVLSITQKTY